jgi:hypothetical protein
MSAPYKRFSLPSAQGTQLDRIRRLELGHIDLATDDSPFQTYFAPDFFGFFFSSDDGTNVNGVNPSVLASTVQQQVVTVQFIVYASGIFDPGTGSVYLLGLNAVTTLEVNYINVFGPLSNPPIGFGYCFDDSSGNYESVLFRGSDQVSVRNDNNLTIEAVIPSTGGVVGPTSPFTFAAGDILMAGTIIMQLTPPEQLPQLFP